MQFRPSAKGTVLLAGNIGYESSEVAFDGGTGNQSNTFAFAPKIGCQFTDHWTVGISGGISHTKSELRPISTDSSMSILKTNSGCSKSGVCTLFETAERIVFNLRRSRNRLSTETDSPFASNTSDTGSGFYSGITPQVSINLKKRTSGSISASAASDTRV